MVRAATLPPAVAGVANPTVRAVEERQSRRVFGLNKLNAKKMKMAELMITNDHRP
jgi:hypothetical protein